MLRRLPWPLPALLVWTSAWLLFVGLTRLGLAGLWAMLIASAWGVVMAGLGGTWWRRGWIALGFPLALGASGLAALPAWAWLLPLALCLAVYPLNAWRDAPLFPTPAGALAEMPRVAPLHAGALVLDAGCGLGHGLAALRQAYPGAELHGLEWSWPLRLWCGLRCPWARVRHGDIWRADWSAYVLVYLFQRPESMPRAVEKARAELRPGAWLVSLEFEAHALRPKAVLRTQNGRSIWMYQVPFAE
jgi:SAM-dependent methyltransferase